MRSVAVRGRMTVFAMRRWNFFRSSRERMGLCGDFVFNLVKEGIGFEGFMVDFIEGGDAIVPFQEGGGVPAETDGVIVHLPDRIENGMIVGIEDVFFEFGMPGNVDLAHAV